MTSKCIQFKVIPGNLPPKTFQKPESQIWVIAAAETIPTSLSLLKWRLCWCGGCACAPDIVCVGVIVVGGTCALLFLPPSALRNCGLRNCAVPPRTTVFQTATAVFQCILCLRALRFFQTATAVFNASAVAQSSLSTQSVK